MRYIQFYSLATDWKIPQSNWPRAFWTISLEPEFSQIWNLFKHIAITVIQTLIIEKINELRKKNNFRTLVLAYFPHLGGKTLFSQNLALPCTTLHGPETPCWVIEKTKEPIPRKTEGLTDLIHIYDSYGHGQGSYKWISQLRGIAADNKNKIHYNSA